IEPGNKRYLLTLDKDTFAVFPKGIHLKNDFASEQFEVQPKVRFRSHFPRYILIAGLVFFDARHKAHVITEMIGLCTLRFHRCEEQETDILTQVVVTYLPYRPSYFEVVYRVIVAPERLIGQYPARRCGREKAETISFRKVFGAVEPGIHFQKIAVIV